MHHARPRPVSANCIRLYLPSEGNLESSMKDITYYENSNNAKQQAYLKLQCNCVLCSTSLELKYENHGNGEIKEEAHCPKCDIRARVKIHPLQ